MTNKSCAKSVVRQNVAINQTPLDPWTTRSLFSCWAGLGFPRRSRLLGRGLLGRNGSSGLEARSSNLPDTVAFRPPPASTPAAPILPSPPLPSHGGEPAGGRGPRGQHLRHVPPGDVRPHVPDEGAPPLPPTL